MHHVTSAATHQTDSGMLPQSRILEPHGKDRKGKASSVHRETAVAIKRSRGRARQRPTDAERRQSRGETTKARAAEVASRPKAEPKGSVEGQGRSVSSHVFVLDRHGKPLMPCSPARARQFLNKDRAKVHRFVPFTIRLVDRTVADSTLQPVALKLDPGSKTTGFALTRVEPESKTEHVLHLMELSHRGAAIKKAMTQRSGYRRRRRTVNLRYRPARFDNRTKPEGWLAPSLRHRVETVESWTRRYSRLAPLTDIHIESVKFDTHLLSNPEVSGIGYQQGELQGYEVREYLLERDGRTCVYCGIEHTPLQVEHVRPKASGGSNRVSNLVMACGPCNTRKGTRPVEEFLKGRPEVLARVLRQLKTPLRDAAAVNATRHAIRDRLKALGLPVSGWSGGRTKFNRSCLGVPKTHCLDAACVGELEHLAGWSDRSVLLVKATGRGDYQRTRVDASGFPRGYLLRRKDVNGFRTGDLVKAVVPSGKKRGTHVGRVAVRATGSFNVQKPSGTIQGVSCRHCVMLQRADGYGYSNGCVSSLTGAIGTAFLPVVNDRVSSGV